MQNPNGCHEAKLITVIKTTVSRGEGTKDDLCRFVHQYWDINGELLAEYDPEKSNLS